MIWLTVEEKYISFTIKIERQILNIYPPTSGKSITREGEYLGRKNMYNV